MPRIKAPITIRNENGNYIRPDHRAVPPVPEQRVGEPPDEFSKEEKREWKVITERLAAMKILDLTSHDTLVQWCKTAVKIRELDVILKNPKNWFSVNAAGTRTTSAEHRAWMELTDKQLKLAREMGQTPASHAGIRLRDRFGDKPKDGRSERGKAIVA